MKKIMKRKLKGMTLMEIIIAIAIVAVMSTVLVVAASAINNYLYSARNVNDRVANQAPIAQAKDVKAGHEVSGGVSIKLTPTGGSFSADALNKDIELSGKSYAVYNDAQMQAHTEEFGRGLNLRFITDLETSTEAPTSPST